MMKTTPRILAAFFALAVPCSLVAATPQGWILAGSAPKSYETSVDHSVLYSGMQSAYLKSTVDPTNGFGTLMQSFAADHYRGKRVRFSAYVKSDHVNAWAGLWMRIDKGRDPVGFDNMQKRPIKGQTEWTPYAVVLDVPTDATGISFGILLTESGTVWLSGVRFELVDDQTAVTGSGPMPTEPTNLDFAAP
jgi:hypothetical protein